jgi:autotransporter translocation and assembly factor TamB
MIRRLLHTSWILVLALALLAAGAIYYAGWTESGLQRLASLASRRLGPVTLSIAGARGTLHGGLHVDRIEVDHQRVRVVVTGVDGRIALLPLLWQTIRVSRLELGNVRVEVLPHTGPPSEPWQPHFLAGLLGIEVARLELGHAAIVAASGTTVEADRLSLAAQLGPKEIRVFDGTLHYSGFAVHAAGVLHAVAALRMHAERMHLSKRERRLAEHFTSAHPAIPVAEVIAQPEDVHDLDGLRVIGTILSRQDP